MKKEVQVFINNLLFPKTLDELLNYASCGETSNVETIINHSTIDCAVARWAHSRDARTGHRWFQSAHLRKV